MKNIIGQTIGNPVEYHNRIFVPISEYFYLSEFLYNITLDVDNKPLQLTTCKIIGEDGGNAMEIHDFIKWTLSSSETYEEFYRVCKDNSISCLDIDNQPTPFVPDNILEHLWNTKS